MWEPVIRSGHFSSNVNARDERQSTGKWLVPVEFGDPDGVWERIQVATAFRRFAAVKISAPTLSAILGHRLVCVYSESSEEEQVGEVLRCLREIGVQGNLTYKTDLATFQGRDDKLWTSEQLEGPSEDMSPAHAAM